MNQTYLKKSHRVSSTILKLCSAFFRRLPCNCIINAIPKRLSLMFKNTQLNYIFNCNKIGVRWSAIGFPDLMTRHMMFSGVYQEDVLATIKTLAKQGDIIFDIGAHHGLMAVIAGKTVGNSGKVIAFDPNPYVLQFIKEHLRLNKINNVKIEQLGLMDREGELNFYPQKGNATWNSSFIREFVDPQYTTESIKVKTTTVDQYIQETGLIPNLIKIDTEGTEIHILKGGIELIEKHKPTIIMEFNPKATQKANTTIAEIVNLLKSLSYRLFVIKPNILGRYNFDNQEIFNEKKHSYGKKLVNVICISEKN